MTVKHEAFLDLEASLVSEIEPNFIRITNQIVGRVSKAIREHDLTEVNTILLEIDAKKIYRGKVKKINLLLQTGLVFGASRISGSARGLHLAESDKTQEFAKLAQDQFLLQLEGVVNTYRRRMMALSVKLDARVSFEEQNEVEFTKGEVEVKKINPINIPNALTQRGSVVGRDMLNIAASLQMSRVSQYGFAAEATARGITTYKVNEVLDSATCPVCRRMHGREFKVKNALRKLDALIRITDPNDIKLLAPFPRQDSEGLKLLDKMTKAQLQQAGFDTPPYHPRCRGLLTSSQDKSALSPTRADQSLVGVGGTSQVQPRVAEFLDSVAGQNLALTDKEFLVGAATGVTDFSLLPVRAKRLVEDFEDDSVVR